MLNIGRRSIRPTPKATANNGSMPIVRFGTSCWHAFRRALGSVKVEKSAGISEEAGDLRGGQL